MGEGRKTPQDAELCSGCLARTWLPPDCERPAIKALIFLRGVRLLLCPLQPR